MSFVIGDHIKELVGLMEILGLAEYFKEKVVLTLYNLCNLTLQLRPIFRWKMTIGKMTLTCQNLLTNSPNRLWAPQQQKVASPMPCSIRQQQVVSDETLTRVKETDISQFLQK